MVPEYKPIYVVFSSSVPKLGGILKCRFLRMMNGSKSNLKCGQKLKTPPIIALYPVENNNLLYQAETNNSIYMVNVLKS